MHVPISFFFCTEVAPVDWVARTLSTLLHNLQGQTAFSKPTHSKSTLAMQDLSLYLYIYKRKFARLSLTLSVTPITRLQLPTSTLQPSNAINLDVKFITSSLRSIPRSAAG